MSEDFNGVAALVETGSFLDEKLQMKIVPIGREGLDYQDSCTLVAYGRFLCFTVRVDGGFVFSQSLADGLR